MQNDKYWGKRFEQLEDAQMNKGAAYYQELDKQFKDAQMGIQGKLEAWYGRLASNNGDISLQEAKQLLDKNELAEFHWNVEQYIKHGQENAISHEWEKQLENASAKYHINHLEQIQIEMQQQVEVLYGNMDDGLGNTLKDIYQNGYYHTAFELQKGMGVGSSLDKLDTNRIDKAVSQSWTYDGRNFSDRIWTNKEKLVSELNTHLTQSIIRGESPDKAIREIANRMNVSKSAAGTLVMTESAFQASASQRDCFNDLDVEKYVIVATLDDRTSDICQSLDGQVFDMKDYEVGSTAPPFHCNCYDKETEIYTDSGWKYFKDLQLEDKVYTLDKNTYVPEWQKPLKHISYQYKGDMLLFMNARSNIMVTPEHNMLVQNMDSSVKSRPLHLRQANTIGTKSKNRMYSGCRWSGKRTDSVTIGGRTVDIETYLKFMAYWLADGSCTPYKGSYSIKIAQCNNDWMVNELSKFPFKIFKCKQALMIHDLELGKELSQYGKCDKKYVPEIVKELTPELINVFLDAYSKTDGHVSKGKIWKGYQFSDSVQFFTTSDRMASDLGELIMKGGGRPEYAINKCKGRQIQFSNGLYTINHDMWIISYNKQLYSWICNMEVQRIPYDDMVYCVEVEKHNTLLVRRNGRVVWSGNCRSCTAPYFDDDVSTRAARSSDGKTYEVPSNMTYKDWKKQYVDAKSDVNLKSSTKSEHAEQRMEERKVEQKDIEDALKNPLFKSEPKTDNNGRTSVKYVGESATVCYNQDTNNVITVWKTGKATRRKYKGGNDAKK